jgi:3,2-trans-enoyl-CoA isomerase
MVNTIGHRETEKALQLGLLYSTDEALKINLIDEVANDEKDLLARAEKQIVHWSRIPGKFNKLIYNPIYGFMTCFIIYVRRIDGIHFLIIKMMK